MMMMKVTGGRGRVCGGVRVWSEGVECGVRGRGECGVSGMEQNKK